MDIAQQIREKIAHYRSEILRLESALEVIGEVTGKPAKAEKPMITIRKTIDHEPAAEKPTQRRKHKVTPQQIDAAVIAYIQKNGPSRSADIGKAIKVESKRLWSRLWQMNKDGTLSRDESNVYHLVQAGSADPGVGVEQAA